ncbi:MAG: transposase [Candidatus Nealsonbacteria bacterium]
MRIVKFAPGQIYHIYNRGVDKRDIFLEDNDRWRYLQVLCLFNEEKNSSNLLWKIERDKGRVNLKMLKDYIIKEGKKPLVRILAYCLMSNHYHLLIEELTEGGIVKFMHRLGGGYSQYFNKKYDRSGSLLEGPFKAVLVKNETYLQYLLIYINVINPGRLAEPKLKEEGIKSVEAIIKAADEYLWSTHQEYSGKRGSIIIDKGLLGEFFPSPEAYYDFIRQVLLGKQYQEIFHLTLED